MTAAESIARQLHRVKPIDLTDPQAEVRLCARAMVALENAERAPAWAELLEQLRPHDRDLLQQLMADLAVWGLSDG